MGIAMRLVGVLTALCVCQFAASVGNDNLVSELEDLPLDTVEYLSEASDGEVGAFMDKHDMALDQVSFLSEAETNADPLAATQAHRANAKTPLAARQVERDLRRASAQLRKA